MRCLAPSRLRQLTNITRCCCSLLLLSAIWPSLRLAHLSSAFSSAGCLSSHRFTFSDGRSQCCSSRSSSRGRSLRRARTTTTTAMMMASSPSFPKRRGGPNAKKSTRYFDDWSIFEAEARCYLKEREENPISEAEEKARTARDSNSWGDYFNPFPQMGGPGEPEDPRDPGGLGGKYVSEPDVMAYTELGRYGYDYLVSSMVYKHGGYHAVSERLGVELVEQVFEERKLYVPGELGLNKEPEQKTGYLALGGSIDDRVAARYARLKAEAEAEELEIANKNSKKVEEASSSSSDPMEAQAALLKAQSQMEDSGKKKLAVAKMQDRIRATASITTNKFDNTKLMSGKKARQFDLNQLSKTGTPTVGSRSSSIGGGASRVASVGLSQNSGTGSSSPRERGVWEVPASYVPEGQDRVVQPEWVDYNPPPDQPIELSLLQRVYAVAFTASSAIAYGRATSEALDRHLITTGVTDIANTLSTFLLAASLGSAVASAVLASKKGRSLPLWVGKGAVAGVMSVLELRGKESLEEERQRRDRESDAEAEKGGGGSVQVQVQA